MAILRGTLFNVFYTSPSYVQPSNYTRIFQELTAKNDIQADMIKIRDCLEQHKKMNDPLSKRIQLLENNFGKLIRREFYTTGESDRKKFVEETFKTFIELLQKILVDPIQQTPLDQECYLGSDGRTYAHYSLVLFIKRTPEKYRFRCPLDPENEQNFTSEPHPIARFLIEWLIHKNMYPVNENYANVQREFKIILDNNASPVIATVHNIASLIFMQQEQVRQQERAANRAASRNVHREDLRGRAQRMADEARVRMNRIAEQAREQMRHETEAINAHINQQRALEEDERRRIQEEIDCANEEIKRLKELEKELEENLKQNANVISELHRAVADLEINIVRVEREMAESKSEGWGEVLKAAAIIGICIAINYALPGSGSATGTAAPTQGGAVFKTTIFF